MNCPYCAAHVQDGTRICQGCGARLQTGVAVATRDDEDAGLSPSAQAGHARPREDGEPVLYAGFWRRVGAALIDALILTALSLGIALVVGTIAAPLGLESALVNLVYGGVRVALGVLYYPILESSTAQATLGKRAVGIIVTDLEGRRISFWRAVGRELARLAAVLSLGIGYLMVAFTRRKQGLHDLLASTLVVRGRV